MNYSDLGHALGLSHTTLRRYLDLLNATLIVRQLQPWHENIPKRQVKTPKLYFRDSGIFHQLLGIQNIGQLAHSPKLGASFEGYVIEEIIKHYQARPESAFFWKIHSGPELDLLLLHQGKRIGFEIKYTDSPSLTRSLVHSQEYLNLDETFLVYNGTRTFPLTPTITAIGIETLLQRPST